MVQNNFAVLTVSYSAECADDSSQSIPAACAARASTVWPNARPPSVAVSKELKLDAKKVNVNGGSVALGHPIGASGCRVLITLIYEMIKQDKRIGLASLCLGGGEAVAMIVRR